MTQPETLEQNIFTPTKKLTLSVLEYYNFRVKAIEQGINFISECVGKTYIVLVEEKQRI